MDARGSLERGEGTTTTSSACGTNASSADPVTVVVPSGRADSQRSAPSDPTTPGLDPVAGPLSGPSAAPRVTWALQLPLAPPRPGLPPIARPPQPIVEPAQAPPVEPDVATPEAGARRRSPSLAAALPEALRAAVVEAVADETALHQVSLEEAEPVALDAATVDAAAPPLVRPISLGVEDQAVPLELADRDPEAATPVAAEPVAIRTVARVEVPLDAFDGTSALARAAKPWTHSALEWIGIVAGALLVALVIKAVLIQAFVIPSRSMEPTLNVGDRVLVLKPSYTLGDIDRGDVIVFKRPELLREGNDTSDLIKRVIGLPGETVEGRDGRIVVDGEALDEPWLPAQVFTSDFGPIEVPDGKLWVMGDNRGNSKDSRVFGLLDEDDVIGEAVVRWWPAGRFGGL